ncbi:hypothetical protein SAMN05720606_10621 [Paenibacillus polysaccharolyticus]|uniref:Uncharacterized protein n=1 Tax=Paenibacillus polysaccharolyticus TaxID=582692 RepID=A0A1G5GSV3_9BACL|nr:hypothetical protein [Paenibacillus polysaccharolyticus]SCY54481.1 hypothetical protein SAMN05720606_10621 [Paenibacillus polysaccharolyticus]
MSMSLIEKVISLENHDELHTVRLLVLISTIVGKKRETTIQITKLAKLDFILRYPAALYKALDFVNGLKDALITESEKNNIESEMLAFNYSPWSSDFRRLLVLLTSRSLISWSSKGNSIELSLTKQGEDFYNKIIRYQEFSEIIQQSKSIKTNFSKLSMLKLDSVLSEILNPINLYKHL